MKWNKLIRTILLPHTAVTALLIIASAVLLALSAFVWETQSVYSYASYVISAYTLTVLCIRIPDTVRFVRDIKNDNRYVRQWLGDARLRVNVTLVGSTLWNAGYAFLQLGLGIYHRSAWFYSLAGYYFSLALMRFFLVRHSTKNRPGEKLREELVRYRACGWTFLVMNSALSVMMFYLIGRGRATVHHEIITITMAAYTFLTLTFSIINVVKYRKYGSPVFSAAKAISLASASVSMLTLESTMLVTFSDESMTELTRKMFLGATGVTVFAFIIILAVYMIVQSSKKLRAISGGDKHGRKA